MELAVVNQSGNARPLVALANAGARPTDAVAATCKTSGLVVWIDTRGDAAAGSVYYTLKFTNQSGQTCALVGYPGVSAVDLRGQRLGSAASRSPAGARTVTLANDETAGALAADLPSSQLPRVRLPHRPSRRPADLPAEPDHLEGRPDPLQRLLAQRPRLPARQTGDNQPVELARDPATRLRPPRVPSDLARQIARVAPPGPCVCQSGCPVASVAPAGVASSTEDGGSSAVARKEA